MQKVLSVRNGRQNVSKNPRELPKQKSDGGGGGRGVWGNRVAMEEDAHRPIRKYRSETKEVGVGKWTGA